MSNLLSLRLQFCSTCQFPWAGADDIRAWESACSPGASVTGWESARSPGGSVTGWEMCCPQWLGPLLQDGFALIWLESPREPYQMPRRSPGASVTGWESYHQGEAAGLLECRQCWLRHAYPGRGSSPLCWVVAHPLLCLVILECGG